MPRPTAVYVAASALQPFFGSGFKVSTRAVLFPLVSMGYCVGTCLLSREHPLSSFEACLGVLLMGLVLTLGTCRMPLCCSRSSHTSVVFELWFPPRMPRDKDRRVVPLSKGQERLHDEHREYGDAIPLYIGPFAA